MTIWNWFFAFLVGVGVAVILLRRRARNLSTRASIDRRSSTVVGEGIRFPIFAGDRFGDDWGRS